MRVLRTRPATAVVLAAVLTAACYLAATVGVAAWHASRPVTDQGAGNLPATVYRVPETVASTADHGPLGNVALVFPGTRVSSASADRSAPPWILVSSHSGAYRALSAPHLPRATPGAMSVSPTGDLLAWGYDAGVVVYDTVTGRSREVPLDAEGVVGAFSPDGGHLLVHDGRLRVLDVARGAVVGTAEPLAASAVRRAAWRPDGVTFGFVSGGRFVTRTWDGEQRASVRSPIAADATMAWSPDGGRVAALQPVDGIWRSEVFEVDRRGRLRSAGVADAEHVAQLRLFGFTDERTVAVAAQTLETGALTFLLDLSTEAPEPPAELVQLPTEGENWRGPELLAVASGALAAGSVDFEEPQWPWSNRAKLVASSVAGLFFLGLYLTRPTRRRTGAPAPR